MTAHVRRRILALLPLIGLLAACGNGGADEIHDLSTLPNHISVCGRTWVKDSLGRQSSSDEIRTQTGVEPAVVGTGIFAACPPGVCTAAAASDPCHTVVYVRVGEDAYLGYELSGGP